MATVEKPKQPRKAPRLTKGFDDLALSPNPRLRQRHRQLARRNLFVDAWNVTAEALTEATKTVGRQLTHR